MDKLADYECNCTTGWTGPTCEQDVKECTLDTDTCDDDPNACKETPGSYTCQCPPGYGGDGRGDSGCTDIDECALNTDSCDPVAECENTPGSYTGAG